jgi:hypothetical protein
VNWTRISEYKHAPNQPAGTKDYPGTVIYRSAICANDNSVMVLVDFRLMTNDLSSLENIPLISGIRIIQSPTRGTGISTRNIR